MLKDRLFSALLLLFILLGSGTAAGAKQTFTLQDIQRYAREHSPLLRAKAAEIGVQKGARTTSRAALLPTLALTGGYNRYRLPHGIIEGVYGNDQIAGDEKLFGNIAFNFVAFDFGKNYFNYRSAALLVTSRREDYAREQQTLAFQLAKVYYDILTVDQTTAATRKTIASLRSLQADIRQKVQVGRLAEVDLLKVEVNLTKAVDDLSKLKALHVQLMEQLRRLMGYRKQQEWDLAGTPIRPISSQHFAVETLLNEAYADRDDLKSIRQSITSVEYQKKSVTASYLPQVSLQAAVSEQSPGDSSFTSDAAVGVVVSMPLFDGFSRKGQQDKYSAERSRLHALWQDKRLGVAEEVKTALADYRESLVRVEATQSSLNHAREVLRIERLKYRLGRTPINFVLEAEASFLTTQSLFYQAYYNHATALANIRLAVGKMP